MLPSVQRQPNECGTDYLSSRKPSRMMKRIALAAAPCAGCAVPMQTVDASRAACASYGCDAFAECVMTELGRHVSVDESPRFGYKLRESNLAR